MNHRSDISGPQRFSRRRAERGARRRKRILDAAEAVFSERGYHEASVTEIAERADLAAGTIYLYFSDKAHLYGSVVLGKMHEVVARLEAALNSHPSAKSSLRAAVESLFAYYDSNRQFFELFLHQQQMAASPLNETHWNEMEDLKRRNRALIEECVARGQRKGELKPGDPRLYAVAFLGITLQMIRQWIRERGEGRLSTLADFAVECFLNGAAAPRS
jgi:TetR/AcrR family fatty acid metabolism transcriptional regulator